MYMTGALTAGRRLIAYPQDTSGVRNLTGSSEPATGVTRVGPAARRSPRRRPSPPRLSGPCRAVLRGYALALVLAPLAPPRRQPSAQIPGWAQAVKATCTSIETARSRRACGAVVGCGAGTDRR